MHYASDYESARDSNPVDFMASGIFGAHFVNTVSPTFLLEIVDGQHPFVEPPIRREIANKYYAGCSFGILNAPDPAFNPQTDKDLKKNYGPRDHMEAKRENKRFLQRNLGLIEDVKAPLFFWPSRLDPVQKGCQLMADIFYQVISTWWDQNLQIVFVANGDYQSVFQDIVNHHHFHKRVAMCEFSEQMEHLSYAASDFVLMPSRFEPCGLPQMIAPIYGSLPVAHDTGGIHDTIRHLDPGAGTGNGFLFKVFDSYGLFWAVEEALRFYALPTRVKAKQIKRIMTESAEAFTHENTARQYIDLYEKMLQRPLIVE